MTSAAQASSLPFWLPARSSLSPERQRAAGISRAALRYKYDSVTLFSGWTGLPLPLHLPASNIYFLKSTYPSVPTLVSLFACGRCTDARSLFSTATPASRARFADFGWRKHFCRRLSPLNLDATCDLGRPTTTSADRHRSVRWHTHGACRTCRPFLRWTSSSMRITALLPYRT